MKKNVYALSACLWAATASATVAYSLPELPLPESVTPENVIPTTTLPEDTTKVVDIEEVVVIATPKETSKLRELPTAVSLLSQKDMQAHQITSLKKASALIPNFFVPEYGSRITSAIYIRGIGSRINTPAVGMYVDNIPYVDKSAFDFNFYDIERLDILRGPQGTLYGRNTMGGLIRVHTRSPFSYQGTDVKLSYGSRNNHRSASLTHYHRWSDRFAFSAGGYYEAADGFFRNAYNGQKIDDMEAGGGRIRAIWLPSENWKLDFTVGYDYSDEGGYPYQYQGRTGSTSAHPGGQSQGGSRNGHPGGQPGHPQGGHPGSGPSVADPQAGLIGHIAYNRDCTYRRGLFNTGLNLTYQGEHFTLNAVTGFQNLNDRMFLDQDFSPADIYTLEQKQKLNTLSQEITLKSKPHRRWQWVTGISGFHQWLNTNGPVHFMPDGIDQMLEGNINRMFKMLQASNPRVPEMSLDIRNESLPVTGDFDTPVLSAALYHQSTVNDLFIDGLSLTAGLRVEYEKMSMKYTSASDMHFDFQVTIPQMGMTIPLKGLQAAPELTGKLKHDYVQLLPKVALQYTFPNRTHNVYASVARGYRSGGYNVQMFSDLMQNGLRNEMMETINQASGGMMGQFVDIHKLQAPIDIDHTVYKPEYSWNYEVGAHLTVLDGKLKADVAAFYMDTRDQQIARFATNGLGRMMVNAGSSESYGAEVNLTSTVNRHLSLNASYGYTRATFQDYDAGKGKDYSGHYVPFVPRHTMNAGASYRFFFPGNEWLHYLTVGMSYTGAGKIYWTEANDAHQSFYGTLNGNVSLQLKTLQIDVWGRNLADRDYHTFYFETMGKAFAQPSKPLQIGVDLRYHF